MRHTIDRDAPLVAQALRRVAAERPRRLPDAIEAAIEELVELGYPEGFARAAVQALDLLGAGEAPDEGEGDDAAGGKGLAQGRFLVS